MNETVEKFKITNKDGSLTEFAIYPSDSDDDLIAVSTHTEVKISQNLKSQIERKFITLTQALSIQAFENASNHPEINREPLRLAIDYLSKLGDVIAFYEQSKQDL